MLFDLRSRGRRTTVRFIYLGLALLMGGGLVLFGVGTGSGNGGLLNALTNSGSGNGAQKQVVNQQEQAALKAVRANPSNAAAWGNLLQARWTTAGQGADYDATTGTFTAAGKQELQAATVDWQHYAALTKTPDPSLAILAARAYVAIADYGGAANAWEQETLSEPTSPKGYECLALNAYAANQTRKGELAQTKALSLLPKSEQLQVKDALNSAKSSVSTAQSGAQQC